MLHSWSVKMMLHAYSGYGWYSSNRHVDMSVTAGARAAQLKYNGCYTTYSGYDCYSWNRCCMHSWNV